jgi:hypothetical protein
MGRAAANAEASRKFGLWIGEALGEGIAAGTRQAFESLGEELAPFVQELVDALRDELVASLASASAADTVATRASSRLCEEAGCGEPALARNLCRRHYARKLYQERKARQGTGTGSVPRRRIRAQLDGERGGEPVIEKKLAAVAPIIRRKKAEPLAAPAVEAPPLAAAANGGPVSPLPAIPAPVLVAPTPQAPGVSVESVARFFGLNKG